MAQTNQFPRLKSAMFEPYGSDGEVEVSYKSGAKFKGQVHDHKRIGRGIFTWPNGARYDGEFTDNVRTGSGLQLWPDGSQYEGGFSNDLRHGEGEHTWANKENYLGQFFQDRRHGNGTYSWPDGSTYKGTFYMDRKEGFGLFHFANGNTFEGLYKEDERAGPGVLTYPDGSQDVGLWQKEKLIKVCTAVKGAFSMSDHKELEYDPSEHIRYLDLNDPTSLEEFENRLKVDDSYGLDNKLTERVSDIFNIVLDPRSLAINKEAFDNVFYPKEELVKKDTAEKVKVWNRTPSVVSLQKHFYKHRYNRTSMAYSVDKIINGDRSKFKKKGALELASEELIAAATSGDLQKVEELLASGKVSSDVADCHGRTPLIGATVNWHIDVINCLLNHGADVNKLTDEGCSALSAGCVFFYPTSSFRYNIAERYLKAPDEAKQKKSKSDQTSKKSQTQSTSQTQGAPKSILSKKQTGSKKNLLKADYSGSNGHLDNLNQGDTSKSVRSDQVAKQTPRQQVRIDDNSEKPQADANIVENGGAEKEEFDSQMSLKYYEIDVSDQLIERCATQLSMNEKVVGGQRSHNSAELGTVRHLAVVKNERERMKATLDLLLRRGADPNASGVPMPVLFFAIKSADVDMVKALLSRGASSSIVLQKEKGGLAPLHIACAIPGEEGVLITELLLQAGADPDVRAVEDDSFLSTILMEEWIKDPISPGSQELLGGRTPLQICCARDDNYRNITRVVHLLLQYRANSDLLCNGFSPLALCIASGNDMAIDELLVFGNEVSLPLTHGVGSALCAATRTEYEYRRPITARLQLIDKLIRAGANILAPIPIGPKRVYGTAVDYAYYMFHQDTYIAKTPYHALTHSERETFINRRKLLEHLGDILRVKAIDREKRRLDDERTGGVRSVSPSSGFVYIGAGAQLPPDARKPKFLRNQALAGGDGPMVTFESHPRDGSTPFEESEDDKHLTAPRKHLHFSVYAMSNMELEQVRRQTRPQVKFDTQQRQLVRKPLFKYCYQCGRSVFVRLSACTRCKEVFYCSKACKLKAWNARHKEECIRIGGRSRSPSPRGRGQRAESPTPATNPDKGKRTTVAELNRDKQGMRIHGNMQYTNSEAPDQTVQQSELRAALSAYLQNEGQHKGHSMSAKGSKFGEKDPRRIHSEHHQVPWKTADGQYVDNYSFV